MPASAAASKAPLAIRNFKRRDTGHSLRSSLSDSYLFGEGSIRDRLSATARSHAFA